MPDLRWGINGVNYLGLILALWLGLCLVSGKPKFPIVWSPAAERSHAPGTFSFRRWRWVLLGYFLALLGIVWRANSPFLQFAQESEPLFLNNLKTGCRS